jgi:IMP cyclohydrolase
MAMTKSHVAGVTLGSNREDLSDILTILEPERTPLLSLAKKGKANGTFFEWQTDDLATPAFAGVLEGEDETTFTNQVANRAKLGNYIQVFRQNYQVSNIQELVDVAGVDNEFANAEGKAVRQMKRDIESALCSAQDRDQDDGTNPYKTRGLFKWLGEGGQPSDVPADYQSVASVSLGGGSLTESALNGMLQDLYEANGMPGGQLTLLAGPSLKRDISDFARQEGTTTALNFQVTQPAESKSISLVVNLYDGDFGSVAITPSLFLNRTSGSAAVDTNAGLLIDPEYIAVNMLKAESSSELENKGGGRRGFCETIAGLACLAPKAHGKIN